jgi:hypothetical protein
LPLAELRNTVAAKLAGEEFMKVPPGGKVWRGGEGG